MIKKRFLIENACYHLIIRGNQKQEVFQNQEDYLVYIAFLKRFKRKHGFRLYAYCLMPNHVHLLGESKDVRSMPKFMHDLNRTYTLYFNTKYDKVGHLWQGRYKSKIITKDEYLLNCLSYIELNPVRSSLTKSPSEYSWSSYQDRVSIRNGGIVDVLNL